MSKTQDTNDRPGGNLTKYEIAYFKEAFALLDLNKDGQIDEEELKTLGDNLGESWQESEIKGLIEPFDPQQTDRIDFPNMLLQFQHKENEDPLDFCKEAFDLINGGNDIDAAAVRTFMASIGQTVIEEESKEIVKISSKQGSGITYDDFKEMWTRNEAPQLVKK